MCDPKPPTLNYRRTSPRSSEPVRWGRVIDKVAGIVMVLLMFIAFIGCVFYPFIAAIVGTL